ncbi:MAG: D-allose transporter substrate-binding protein [Candidatus Vecturithrix sp.]|jgi:D-allose transport system substrate-binding protein|nr:D-allose transporter substrate-binding protein [Candidatus Vecturithrix sp.]
MKKISGVVVAMFIISLCLVIGANAQELKFAAILKTLANPHWVSMQKGYEEEAARQGVVVEVFAVTSEGNIQEQLQLFETVLQKKYDGIAFSPITPVNLIPTVIKANEQGIPVVNVDEGVDQKALADAGGKIAAFIRTDNYAIGQTAADFIASKLPDGGKVAIIEGMAGNASGDARRDGFKDKIATYTGFEVVASQPADWDRIKALDVATNVMSRNEDLKAIYCANDTMALGAVQAVKNAGRDVMVVGTDGIDEAVQSVQAGEMAATVAQDPYAMGVTAVQTLIKLVKGEEVEFDMLVPSKLIAE